MNNPRPNYSLQNRQVDVQRAWTPQDSMQDYDPYWANTQPVQPQYIIVDESASQANSLAPLSQLARSLQNVFQVQMAMLQDMDRRMNRLEEKQQAPRPRGENFYAQTWWALWGILMLILGAALIVVVLLIFRA